MTTKISVNIPDELHLSLKAMVKSGKTLSNIIIETLETGLPIQVEKELQSQKTYNSALERVFQLNPELKSKMKSSKNPFFGGIK